MRQWNDLRGDRQLDLIIGLFLFPTGIVLGLAFALSSAPFYVRIMSAGCGAGLSLIGLSLSSEIIFEK